MIRLAVAGASGRTGSRVIELACRDDRFDIAAALTGPGCPDIGSVVPVGGCDVRITDRLDAVCDVLIDFTLPAGTMAWLEVCRERCMGMVIGATGHSDEQLATIREAAKQIPIVRASNFSVGIQALMGLVGKLAVELGDAYDVEIVETHHRNKIDAPSGTALSLADEIAGATGRTRDDVVFGRQGKTGKRPVRQIGVHAVRMGDVVGEHEIHFSGPGETITLRHRAHSRDAFASGALRAACWLYGKPPGLYTPADFAGS